ACPTTTRPSRAITDRWKTSTAYGQHPVLYKAKTTTEVYTLSLHDALPISAGEFGSMMKKIFEPETQTRFAWERWATLRGRRTHVDRKSTRLNSSHVETSYAVFCLKKKTTRTVVTSAGHERVGRMGGSLAGD